MRKIIYSIVVALLTLTTVRAEELTAEQFLDIVRKPPRAESWAKMQGDIIHKERNKKTISAPIYLAIKFTPNRLLGQVVINNDFGYMIGQAYTQGADSTSVISMNDENGIYKYKLSDFGVRPDDLTMSFLYWDFVEELESTTIKGQKTRLMILESPNKNTLVKVYISSNYYFPLKVEWFKKVEKNSEYYRKLEITSFQKKNDFWLIKGLTVSGPGWKTLIKFNDTDAELMNDASKNIFLNLNANK
jgi:hypothetical protein